MVVIPAPVIQQPPRHLSRPHTLPRFQLPVLQHNRRLTPLPIPRLTQLLIRQLIRRLIPQRTRRLIPLVILPYTQLLILRHTQLHIPQHIQPHIQLLILRLTQLHIPQRTRRLIPQPIPRLILRLIQLQIQLQIRRHTRHISLLRRRHQSPPGYRRQSLPVSLLVSLPLLLPPLQLLTPRLILQRNRRSCRRKLHLLPLQHPQAFPYASCKSTKTFIVILLTTTTPLCTTFPMLLSPLMIGCFFVQVQAHRPVGRRLGSRCPVHVRLDGPLREGGP